MRIWRKNLHIAGFARPKRNIIQGDFILLRSTIDDTTHSAVTYHQSLLEEYCRFVVMQHLCTCLCYYQQA